MLITLRNLNISLFFKHLKIIFFICLGLKEVFFQKLHSLEITIVYKKI